MFDWLLSCSMRSLALALLVLILQAFPAAAGNSERLSSGVQREIDAQIAANGFARVMVFVHMPEAARTAAMQGLETAHTRAAAKAQIAAAIEEVSRRSLPAFQTTGRHFARLETFPAFAAQLTAAEIDRLKNNPGVERIVIDGEFKALLTETVPMTGALRVPGVGVGATVAVLDTAILRTHPFLPLPLFEGCFLHVAQCPNGTTSQKGAGAAAITTFTASSHGTHVAGIVVGSRPIALVGPPRGMASGARLIHITVLDNTGQGFDSNMLRGLEYLEELAIAAPAVKIAAFNFSIGRQLVRETCDDAPAGQPFLPLLNRLRARGILGVFAAGNDSSTGGLTFPACLSPGIAVASIAKDTAPFKTSSFTNVNRFTDLWAPGGETGNCINSSVPTGGFAKLCGTSMSAPHVTGAIALLRANVPSATACQIEDALRTTGGTLRDTRVTLVRRAVTRRMLSVDGALSKLRNPARPANDNFASARPIPSSAMLYDNYEANMLATIETGEPNHGIIGSAHSLWWRWTPDKDVTAYLRTAGSSFNTVLAVYTGSTVGALTLVHRNNDVSIADKTSALSFPARAGTTYMIAVAGLNAAAACNAELLLKAISKNDAFAARSASVVIPGSIISKIGNDQNSSVESGEPREDSLVQGTVWHALVPVQSGRIAIRLTRFEKSSISLSVFTGSTFTTLTRVANELSLWPNSTYLTFDAVAGRQYSIRLHDWQERLGG